MLYVHQNQFYFRNTEKPNGPKTVYSVIRALFIRLNIFKQIMFAWPHTFSERKLHLL